LVKEKMTRTRAFILVLTFATILTAQETSREKRAPIWVYLETVPGNLAQEQLKAKAPPIQELDDLSRFVLGGMIFGWKFSYTPSDTARGVNEYFSLEPIQEVAPNDPRFTVSNIVPEYPRLTCWAIFTLDDAAKRWEVYWSSSQFRTASGIGKGDRKAELNGIRNAYMDAVRDAVRQFERKREKNKPKEIRGEALLRDNPRLYLDAGQFIADIDLIVNVQAVIPYSTY
jgi:hypothetical protein